MKKPADRSTKLERWLQPFLQKYRNKKQARWAPVYLQGLLSELRRKSVEPMAAQVAPGETQQLHHFVSTSPWALEPLEQVLAEQADALVGGEDALLIVDDTALVKKGRHSVGVGHQYCGELGKKANCQCLVSLTLSRGEAPVCVGLRLFLPEAWSDDEQRRQACGVPATIRHRPKWRIALEELDRVRHSGVRFGAVVADAGYGSAVGFRAGLSERGQRWAVGILSHQLVYPADVQLSPPAAAGKGRPAKHPRPSVRAVSVRKLIEALGAAAWRTISWRKGTKGALKARFAMVRVRAADGPTISHSRRLPGAEVWLICEERADGERRYHLSNLPATSSPLRLARVVKGRWTCEQAHQQMKQQLGLDHFEGRSWLGLHHHCLMVMIGMLYLQWLRLAGSKKKPAGMGRRPVPACRRSSGS